MVVPFIVYHYVVIGSIFITFALVVLLFVISIAVLIININKIYEGTLKKRIILIVLSSIGIITSVPLSLPYLKLFYKATQEQTKVQRGIIDFDKLKDEAGGNTIITWNKDVLGSGTQKSFIYENKKYIKFDTFTWRDLSFTISDIRGIEINKLTGIILDEEQEKDTFFNGLYNVVFPVEATERVLYKNIYTVKNCNDQSLLIVKYNSLYNDELFCDEEYFLEKYNYYHDINNYHFIISKSDDNTYIFNEFYYIDLKENIAHPLSKNNFDILTINEQKYNNQENGILTLNRFDPNEHAYITIYGISGDGVYKKLFQYYIIDHDDIYYAYAYDFADINAVKLNDDEKTFLLSLLAPSMAQGDCLTGGKKR
jgi:hypothetical protein